MRSNTIRKNGKMRYSDKTQIEPGDLDRNLLNMVHFYKDSLQGLIDGQTSLESIPLGNRRRFIEQGVVRKFGSRYELTEIGLGLLLNIKI